MEERDRISERIRQAIRVRGYSPRTAKAYLSWTRRFRTFHRGRRLGEMGAREINAFLTDLAVRRNVSASTQNQAASALLFLYREVLGREVEGSVRVVRARSRHHLPVVLSRSEVRALLSRMRGVKKLVAAVLYGSGVRLREGLSLRVKDVDPERGEILVRDAKGNRDRVTTLPRTLAGPLGRQIERVRGLHQSDIERGACWRTATTSARSRSCWATRASGRP